MDDQWEMCVVSVSHGEVRYYSPQKWNYFDKTADFMKENYPTTQLDGRALSPGILIMQLLKDGWEPYANYSIYANQFLSFRRKL